MSTSTAQASEVSITRVAVASLIGTTIEFYDFFIFGTASALVFGKIFFSNLSPVAGVLASFATFGVAFAARPLGALIFGHFGDRIGRKQMLVTSLLIMGIGTAAIGCLPTYATIGVAAPISLVLCRLLQGAALGGEWGGAVLMALEHAPGKRRGFYSSWPQAGVPLGLVLGTAMFYGVQQLPGASLMSWGWRIPFLASFILVGAGLYIRLKIEDSPALQAVKEADQVERFPAFQALRTVPVKMLLGVLANTSGIPFYIATTFVYVYGKSSGLSHDILLLGVASAAFVQCLSVPACGHLVDRFGRKPVMLAGSAATIVWAFPFFALLNTHSSIAVVIAFMGMLPICHALLYTPLSSYLPETFPTQLRYSGAGISYNLGNLIFSAPAPFVAEALYTASGSAWSLALFVLTAGVVSLIAVALSREPKNDAIHWTGLPAEVTSDAVSTVAPNCETNFVESTRTQSIP